jgi:drug/metabolite transporter (DMT)-like permease
VPLPSLAGAGICFAADLGVWHFSVLFTSVANSTLLGNISPIFVALAGWLLWKQRPTRTYFVGLALALGGMFVLAGANFGATGTRMLGDALAALTGAFYAGYMLAIKAARDAGASTSRSMAWSTSITALVLLPIALLAPQPFWPISPAGWLSVLGLALVPQILGQGLIAYAFAHVPASLASLVLLVQPLMAAIFAWALFGEAIGPIQFVGGTTVLAGIWLSKKSHQN